MTTFTSHIQKTTSEKITLCHVEPKKQVMEWTSEGSGIYSRDDSQVIINVEHEATALTKAESASVGAGEWFYDVSDGTLYIKLSDSSDPANTEIYITYRYFFSNIPINLPYDLSTEETVYYDGRLKSFSPISYNLDDENIGIAVESNTSVNLENTDGFFDEIFDTLFWEYKTVKIWQYSSNLPVSEAKKVFEGTIEDKSFNQRNIIFKCKDFAYNLRRKVNLELFDSSDGTVSDTYLDTPKRRLYGQFKNLRCIPIDNILNGFPLTGTITGSTFTLTGTGTSFLDEVSPNDEIIFFIGEEETYSVNVESVNSDTSITIDSELDVQITALTGYCLPEIAWRKKNRNWHIAGHKLRSPSTTITDIINLSTIKIANVDDFQANNRIVINGTELATINSISANVLFLNQNLNTPPALGQTVQKEPVSRAFAGVEEFIIDRDFTISNTSTDAIIQFRNTAEFNVARTKISPGSFTFTNGSRTISLTGIDALNILKPRDWIKPNNASYSTYYEILDVAESEITLRVNFADATITDDAQYKNVQVIGDETAITVDCAGIEVDSTWLRTPAHAVEHLIENDAELTVDSAEFNSVKAYAPYTLSYVIPKRIGDDAPIIRDAINDINKSVIGSLFFNNNFQVSYSIVDPNKPSDLIEIEQDDIIGEFSVESKNECVRSVNAKYRPFYDAVQNEETFKFYTFTNTFTSRLIGSTEDRDIILYLFKDSEAQTIAQRYAFMGSLSRSIVRFKTNLLLTNTLLNDKLKINFRRLYKRFGNQDRSKIGLINSIKKSNNEVEIEINDLGNIFNRVANWSNTTANNFAGASNDEKIFNGYWVDNTKEVPDTTSEKEKNQNRFA